MRIWRSFMSHPASHPRIKTTIDGVAYSKLDETERGVKVSDEALLDDEDGMLKEIEFGDDFVRIITDHHQFELDLKKVDEEDIEQAKTFLKRMNFDNRFEIRIVK